MKDIIVITTGGTIEKTYDEETGILMNRHSQLRSMMKKIRLPYTRITQQELLCKDSLEMTDKDRQAILKSVESYLFQDRPIVILHGTDTMAVTAQYIYDNIRELHVPVVFTGAMRPFGFENSDAIQNFTEALMACSLLKPGVYISMHNEIHTLPGVRKNREKRTFESFDIEGDE